MKWYEPIDCDNTVPDPFVCDTDNLEGSGLTRSDFLKGNLIEGWPDNISFQARKVPNDGTPDDALQNHLMLPVYSERLLHALQDERIQGLQFLPIRVKRPNGELIPGFSIVNIINSVSALDLDHSICHRFPLDFANPNVRGKIAGIQRTVLLGDRLTGLDIIRLKDFKQSFFVSERIKNLFEINRFTGYSFEEVELS